MFDVPAPIESKGIKAYRETWDLFYSAQPNPIAFDTNGNSTPWFGVLWLMWSAN
jgi:hypothetical protein